MKLRLQFLIVGMGLLAACSNSAPGINTEPGTASTPMSDEYATLQGDFVAAVGDSTGLTDPMALPTSTGVSYTGVAKLQETTASPDTYLGDMSLTVNFSGDMAVDGKIDNFSVLRSGATSETGSSGSLLISGSFTGDNSLSSPAITGTATGTIDSASGVFLEMTGVFAGTGGASLATSFAGESYVGSGYASSP